MTKTWLVVLPLVTLSLARAAFGQETEEDWRAVLEAAHQARLEGDLASAAARYRRVVAERPEELSAWWYLCTTLYDLGRHAEARDAALAMVNRWPGYGPAYAMLGLSYFHLGNYPGALRNFQQARIAGIGPNPALQRLVRYHGAWSLVRLGQFEAAYEAFKGFAYEDKRFREVVEGLGLCMLRLPYLPEEIPAELRDLVRQVGEATFAWEAGRREEAREQWQALLARFPQMDNLHYSYGVLLQSVDPDEALRQFERAVEENPTHLQALVQVALEYIRRGEYQRARPYAERAVGVDPAGFAGRFALGQVLLELGEAQQAVVELRKAVELAPQKPEVHFALARAYRKLGRPEEARREFEEFQRLNRLLEEAEQFLKERDYSTQQDRPQAPPARP